MTHDGLNWNMQLIQSMVPRDIASLISKINILDEQEQGAFF